MGSAGIGGGAAGPWYRVEAITAGLAGGSADRDYASVLPAALHAISRRRPFIAGWLSRGGGAPLELITNAAPPRRRAASRPPAGAWRNCCSPGGLAARRSRAACWPTWTGWSGVHARAARLRCWPPIRVRLARLGARRERRRFPGEQAGAGPTLFESALQTLMGRPFGWLVVAEPYTGRSTPRSTTCGPAQVLRRYDEEHARFEPSGRSSGSPSWTPTGGRAVGRPGAGRARPPRTSWT